MLVKKKCIIAAQVNSCESTQAAGIWPAMLTNLTDDGELPALIL